MLASDWYWIMNTPTGFVSVLVTFVLCMAILYAAPTILAWSNGCRRVWVVAMVNLFFGWTIFGWAALLVWSLVCGNNAGKDHAATPITEE